ncbi:MULTISPECIES: uracil-DNA glycosylase family protein [unclassified Amycolatopsis]|uniref:uracil-DNA glycosylase family protein n=1 Tax=unclassified Amycolatopsis TaxID=2618356 RepID=UPI0021066C7D|nr:uracil-DNA glycosylase family protein [Amycolatopsis sp. DSM 110486]
MIDDLCAVVDELTSDPSNAWARDLGYRPVWAGSPASRIAIIGQAPGRRAQESGIPWDDASGVRLRSWLGVSDEEFYDPSLFAIVPMDFYFPGKGKTGDLPPRKEFAPRWHPQILSRMPHITLRVLIGAHAQRYYLKGRSKTNLTQTVRSYCDYLPAEFPLVHPSPLNYRWHGKNSWFTAEVVPELARRVSIALGRG